MTDSKTKKCEICGARKPIADFSKSYTKRCKACVAEEARMHRASKAEEDNRIRPKLKDGVVRVGSQIVYYKKAYVKSTGEVVAVTPCDETMHCTTQCFKTRDGRIIPQPALQFALEINWEQRRYELMRDFYLKWTQIDDIKNDVIMQMRIETVERAADILINKLKGGKQ